MAFRLICLGGILLLAAKTCQAEDIEWVTVGDIGNQPDFAGYGAVHYEFRIGKFEVTHSSYVEFLNATAKSDPYGLYFVNMTESLRGGIIRSGEDGDFHYTVKPGHENRPATFVSFWNTLRFVNWLHNGKPMGPQGPTTTEDGAYTLRAEGMTRNTIQRNANANIFLTNEDEWYKAAYYKGSGKESGYWTYPTQSDEVPAYVPPTDEPNSANVNTAVGNLTDVGSYPGSPGPYGTFDQGGNVWEWTESIVGQSRISRGGSWFVNGPDPLGRLTRDSTPASFASSVHGFRVASVVPASCDFDDNFSCDVADLDLLTQAFGTSDERFNLDSSNDVIDEGDRDAWLIVAGVSLFGEPFKLGDTNLDGAVNATDLNVLGLNWLAVDAAGWSAGDFNGDRRVDSQDLDLVGVNWQTDLRPALSMVPEPQTSWLVLATLAFSFRGRTGRRSLRKDRTRNQRTRNQTRYFPG